MAHSSSTPLSQSDVDTGVTDLLERMPEHS
jgi:hypothetical protein